MWLLLARGNLKRSFILALNLTLALTQFFLLLRERARARARARAILLSLEYIYVFIQALKIGIIRKFLSHGYLPCNYFMDFRSNKVNCLI